VLHAVPSGAVGKIIWLLMIICVTPVLEEIIWRGVGRDVYRRNLGEYWWIWNGITFAAWHLSLSGFVSLAVMGCLAAYIAEKHSSVGASIAFHIGYNLQVLWWLL